ncbi:hypothetical protein AVEN_106007-1 [Araneus ventricosus]|uniref:Uncharacterized protein n=1 Tax=Araneus ventricosus TaxID=182803 RepID=A0A4Y2NZM7_ARAVE|nr:hypothetical protein AVEN_193736-1 [Araneus ventricosus]GBN43889.1 hypothetical protein AVEN_106007-1 [Araneus ventricosus]
MDAQTMHVDHPSFQELRLSIYWVYQCISIRMPVLMVLVQGFGFILSWPYLASVRRLVVALDHPFLQTCFFLIFCLVSVFARVKAKLWDNLVKLSLE